MGHRIDVSLKTLFAQPGDGIIRRRIFGARVTEQLPTELPHIRNLRIDMLARTEDGRLHHVEFQAQNMSDMPVRMFVYYGHIRALQGEDLDQTLLYVGRKRLCMDNSLAGRNVQFRFNLVNVREMDAAPLRASSDWADLILAMLAKGDPDVAIANATQKLKEISAQDQPWISVVMLVFSGIIRKEHVVYSAL